MNKEFLIFFNSFIQVIQHCIVNFFVILGCTTGWLETKLQRVVSWSWVKSEHLPFFIKKNIFLWLHASKSWWYFVGCIPLHLVPVLLFNQFWYQVLVAVGWYTVRVMSLFWEVFWYWQGCTWSLELLSKTLKALALWMEPVYSLIQTSASSWWVWITTKASSLWYWSCVDMTTEDTLDSSWNPLVSYIVDEKIRWSTVTCYKDKIQWHHANDGSAFKAALKQV